MRDSGKLRFFDRYIGAVICLLFTAISKFKFGRNDGPIKNILVIELFEMGAAVMAYPSLVYMKKELHNPKIYCLTLKSMKESWKALGIMPEENILTLEEKSLFSFLLSLFKNIIALRKKNIDLVIDYELFMRITSIISFMVKSRYRAGFYRYEMEGLYRGEFHDFKCSFNQNLHISKNFLALTKTAVTKSKEYFNYNGKIANSELVVPKYISKPELRKVVKEKIGQLLPNSYNKIILVCPDVGINLTIRNYPKDNYVKVIKKLLANYPEHIVLLTGIEVNQPTCKYIEKEVNNSRCINFCGKTSTLNELFELLALSEILIANDSGTVHFATLTDTKTLALFGPETPFMYGPLGKCVALYSFYHNSPCVSAFSHKKTKLINNDCLKSISPETVFDFAVRLIENKAEYRTVNNEVPYIL